MKKLVTFRFDEDVLARAKQLAQRDNRTLTNLIETILRRALDGQERDEAPLKMGEDRV